MNEPETEVSLTDPTLGGEHRPRGPHGDARDRGGQELHQARVASLLPATHQTSQPED